MMKNIKISLFIFLLVFSFGIFSKAFAVEDTATVNVSCSTITDTSYQKFAEEGQTYNNLPAGAKYIVIGCLDKYSPTPEVTSATEWTCNTSSFTIKDDPYPGAVKACFYKSLGVPTVINPTVTDITQTSATLGANVTSLGIPASISARGTCRSESSTISYPTDATKGIYCANATGTTTGVFTQPRGSLTCGTTYHYKGYAINATGIGWTTEDATFTTSSCPFIPTLINPTATNITATSATLGATVSSLGTPANLTARGVQYGTVSGTYTVNVPATLAQTVNSPYTVSVPLAPSILAECTTYYYRGYATNNSGVTYGYSPEASFKTNCPIPATVPVVTTNACSSVTQIGLTSGGNVTSDGGSSPLSARGVVWNTSPNPTIANSKKTDTSIAVGSFGTSITGLTANTTYYLRAYATNSVGTGYGNEVVCKTLGSGFYSIKFDKNGGTGVMPDQVFQENEKIFLSKNTFTKAGNYFVRWDTRADGSASAFLDQQEIQTNRDLYLYAQWSSSAPTLPTVQTLDPGYIQATLANARGTITNTGGADINYGGFVYGLTTKAKPASTTIPENSGYTNVSKDYGYYKIGTVSKVLNSLTPNTKYYIRFYAHNIAGIAYGNEITFTTPSSGGTTLTVTKAGTGTGTVTSSPAGINCGSDCTEAYTSGTSVTLSASPDSGVNFTGWSGEGCSGTGTCTVVVDRERSVTATFDTINVGLHWLSVSKTADGSGSVTGEATNPVQYNNINCGPYCSSQTEGYVIGTIARLVANPEPGFKFKRWTNTSCGTWSPTNPVCVLVVSNWDNLFASFEIDPSNPVVVSNTIPSISASKTDVNYNEKVDISWTLDSGDPSSSCVLSGGEFGAGVTKTVDSTTVSVTTSPLKKDTTFTMDCGGNTDSFTITVRPPNLNWDEN